MSFELRRESWGTNALTWSGEDVNATCTVSRAGYVCLWLSDEALEQLRAALTSDPAAPAWHKQALPSEDESRKAWEQIADAYGGVAGR